jgi:hypothetical protein
MIIWLPVRTIAWWTHTIGTIKTSHNTIQASYYKWPQDRAICFNRYSKRVVVMANRSSPDIIDCGECFLVPAYAITDTVFEDQIDKLLQVQKGYLHLFEVIDSSYRGAFVAPNLLDVTTNFFN